MRFELSGGETRPAPVTFIFDENGEFDVQSYLTSYNQFDVICIGGGGGRGGGIDTANTGTFIRNFGGEGGGGGFQRVRGLLAALPDVCLVVVGSEGVAGTNHNSTPGSTTDGGEGGPSSFNGTTCRASGGKGGKRAQTNSTTAPTLADGGEGGIGNSIIAGGGGAGGVAGTPTTSGVDYIPGTDGEDGPISDDFIGCGGGGGAGGVGLYGSAITCLPGTYGGRGSYLPDNIVVAGEGELAHQDPLSLADLIVPGRGGGANASPLTQLPDVYGRANTPGIVVILLTAE